MSQNQHVSEYRGFKVVHYQTEGYYLIIRPGEIDFEQVPYVSLEFAKVAIDRMLA